MDVQALIDDVPLYVNVKEVCRADGSVEALELNYMCALQGLSAYTLMQLRHEHALCTCHVTALSSWRQYLNP